MKTVAKFEKVSFGEWMNFFENQAKIIEALLINKTVKLEKDLIEQSYNAIKLPERATDGSAGYDFFVPEKCKISANPTDFVNQPTGIRCKIEKGYDLVLMPKSGLGTKYGFRFRNTLGLIDSDYYFSENEGHIMFCPIVDKDLELNQGDKIFQGVFRQHFFAVEETPTAIRNGGHGSTGV